MPLIVVGREPGPELDLREVVFEEETAVDRAELHYAREGIAQISGPRSPPRQIDAQVQTLGASAPHAVGKDDIGSEQDVWVGLIPNPTLPHRETETRRPQPALERRFERRLPLSRNIGAA